MSVTITATFQHEPLLREKGISSTRSFGVTFWPQSLGEHLRKHWAAIPAPASIFDTAAGNTPLSCSDEKLFADAVASYITTRAALQQERDAAWTEEVTSQLPGLTTLTDLANCLRLVSAEITTNGKLWVGSVKHGEWMITRSYARTAGRFTLQDHYAYQVVHNPTGLVIETPSHLAQQLFRFIRDEHQQRLESQPDQSDQRQAA